MPRSDPGEALQAKTVASLLTSAAQEFGDQAAIVTDEVTVSFTQLADLAAEAATAFMAMGLERDDRVALWAPNSMNWIIACLGLQCAGGVLVPINTRYKGDEVKHILERSQARLLVTVKSFLGVDYPALLRSAAGPASAKRPVSELADLEQIVLLDDEGSGADLGWRSFLEAGLDVKPQAVRQRMQSLAPSDNMDLMFTSGTTGNPKGVLMTHLQNLETYRKFAKVIQFRRDDKYLMVNPYFHAFGYKAGIIAALLVGMTMYPQAVFSADEAMAQIEREKIAVFPAAPTIYQMILNHPDFSKYDLSSLRVSVTGSASVPVELIKRMQSEMSFEHIHVGWGLTEACGVGTMTRAGDPPDKISGTTGPALYPELELIIADEGSNELPVGEQGEILLRGMSVMNAYFGDEAATAEALDADGWLHTGDIGVLDEEGYLKVTDRKKDMYIVGGFNAYPAEIENTMLGFTKIAQVAVVGVPHDRLGEVGIAFVVLRSGETATGDEILKWCRDKMANFKVPRQVIFRPELPLNAANKVRKDILRSSVVGTELKA
ncbi:MAG: FadD3 family acyl-CoA ligase [Sphingomonadaceae bacterium]|nr:FadD3 family acyl-CoA ligase [Sphingomonadaceae bacterium]